MGKGNKFCAYNTKAAVKETANDRAMQAETGAYPRTLYELHASPYATQSNATIWTTRAQPCSLSATSMYFGLNAWQCPHHGAKNSTTTACVARFKRRVGTFGNG